MFETEDVVAQDLPMVVSFVHNYLPGRAPLVSEEAPGLWLVGASGEAVLTYPFPRNPSDFRALGDLICGEMPLDGAKDFEKLPRFGFTGLAASGDYLYAGSWNSVYELRKTDLSLNRIISHQLMSDIHGIEVQDDLILTVLTGLDCVVLTDMDGTIREGFRIERDLSIYSWKGDGTDWRFLTKQYRGATGYWHFNFVQRFGDQIYLTSRNIAAFIVLDLTTTRAFIRPINHMTVVLLHDGKRSGAEYFFTSVDGKIIEVSAAEGSATSQEVTEHTDRFNRDLIGSVVRLEDSELGYEPNWCRGIEVTESVLYTTIDGRYGGPQSFGLLGLRRETKSLVLHRRLEWKYLANPEDLRFVTGFDVLRPTDAQSRRLP